MSKSFDNFCVVWKELSDKGINEINNPTLTLFLAKNFGTDRTSISHNRKLAIEFGFISPKSEVLFSVNRKKIEEFFNSLD